MTDSDNRPGLLDPVRHFLTGHRLVHRDADGVLTAAIPLSRPEGGGEPELLMARFRAGGANRGITARIASRRVISRDQVPRAALAANQWNAGHLAPRATVIPRPDGEGSSILLDAWLPASPRLEQKQVDLFCIAVLRGARAFWAALDASDDQGIFS